MNEDNIESNKELEGELLKIKLEHEQKLQADYFKGATMIMIVLGAFLKFSVDTKTENDFRNFLPVIGLVVNLGGLMACFFGEISRRAAVLDIMVLNERLGNPLPSVSCLALKYTLICFAYGLIVTMIGFLYIIFKL